MSEIRQTDTMEIALGRAAPEVHATASAKAVAFSLTAAQLDADDLEEPSDRTFRRAETARSTIAANSLEDQVIAENGPPHHGARVSDARNVRIAAAIGTTCTALDAATRR